MLASKTSHTFRVGPFEREGRIHFSPPGRELLNIYLSSFMVGNEERFIGEPGAKVPLQHVEDILLIPAGVPATIKVHNDGESEVRIALAVL